MTIRLVAQAECDRCGSLSRVDHRNMHDSATKLRMSLERQGWAVSKAGRHYCPECNRHEDLMMEERRG